MNRLAKLFVLFVSSSAFASQPGQQLDCADWVFTLPGLQCFAAAPFPCDNDFCHGFGGSNNGRDGDRPGNSRAFDNEGHLLLARSRVVGRCPTDDQNGLKVHRMEVVRLIDGAEDIFASIEDRCWRNGQSRWELDSVTGAFAIDQPSAASHDDLSVTVVFDDKYGRLLLALYVETTYNAPPPSAAKKGYWIAALSGFATTFEVLQSYSPQASAFGFRTPSTPEGFPVANHFDSYWGSVTQPLDLANAHPLQCAYPPTQPGIGDYLQITAPVPTPAPGTANYVLTSVTYQGQTRAGRKASGGRLTGRDASRLPQCTPE